MTEEERETLKNEFPDLWQDCDGPWCGSGWCDLIRATCWAIAALDPEARLAQVKEKFGMLRMYTEGGTNDEAGLAIQYAEKLSKHICESCGERGTLGTINGGSWVKCLCEECRTTWPK